MRRTVICSAMAALMTTAAGLAQPPGVKMPDGTVLSAENARRLGLQVRDSGPIVSVQFNGGNLQEFTSALRASTKDPVNISLQGDANSISIEPMTLQNVSIESALRAALGARTNATSFLPDGSSVFIALEDVRANPNDVPVFVITRSPGSQSRGGAPQTSVDVISIQRLVSGDQPIPADVVLSAIDAGLGLQNAGDNGRPDIKFHKDSGLLLVHGNPQDVSLVSEIVKRLTNDHERNVIESRQRKAASIERDTETKRAAVKLRLTESELAIARDRAAQAEQLAQKGSISASELSEVRLALQRAQAARDMVQIDMERLQQEQDAGVAAPSPSADDQPDPRDQKIRALESRIAELEAELGSKKSPKKP